ncbi:thiazolylpeptide-type bacteriocin [Amycolatopsis sp. cg5]
MNLNLDDLNLDELDVTSLRDTVALPETAASTGSGCSGNTGSCVDPQ